MLVSKIQTYLSEKMHLKKVITKKTHYFWCKSQFIVSRKKEPAQTYRIWKWSLKSCMTFVDFVLLDILKNVNYFDFLDSKHSLSKKNFLIQKYLKVKIKINNQIKFMLKKN
jgi:hypothetical protein